MLKIFICEDDDKQRENIEKHVKNYLMIEEYDMKLQMSTNNPLEVMTYLEENPRTTGLYFLDIDLQHEINGIQLASNIRKVDTFGKIVFITTHSELASSTFKHKIEALDYIIKDEPENIKKRIYECMEIAQDRHTHPTNDNEQHFQINIGHQTRMLPLSEIMYFETSSTPHKVIVHLFNSQLDFYSTMKELKKIVPKDFVHCHRSYIVNINNIDYIDRQERLIYVKNGDSCLASVRGIKRIKKS